VFECVCVCVCVYVCVRVCVCARVKIAMEWLSGKIMEWLGRKALTKLYLIQRGTEVQVHPPYVRRQ
jgi:hypothetical protein